MEDQTQHIAVRRAAQRKGYIASVFLAYKESEQVNDDDVMAALHCSADDYYRLALCKLPNLEIGAFAERVQHIAEYANASAVELANIIKHVEAVRALLESQHTTERTMLKAARDREDISSAGSNEAD